MTFEEWEKAWIVRCKDLPRPKDVWSAALDEAVRVATREGCTAKERRLIDDVVIAIKELKE